MANLVVEACLRTRIPVATSEVHGLAQRGGTVNAGITFGSHTFGFIEKGGADFLLALEILEAQRCIPFLYPGTRAVIDEQKIYPETVRTGKMTYPDPGKFRKYLQTHIRKADFISSKIREIPPVLRNMYVLGRATLLQGFPVEKQALETAIKETGKAPYREQSIEVFRMGAMVKEKENMSN